MEQAKGSSTRVTGFVLLAVGVLVGTCGCGYLGAFYSTNAFVSVPALQPLFELGYWNVAIGFGPLLLGLVLALVGLVLVVANRRRD